MPTSGHTYFIINKKSGTSFDLSGEDQRSIIGFEQRRGDNQKVRSTAAPRWLSAMVIELISIFSQWRLTENSGSWTLQNVYNGKYLDVDIPDTYKDGERVVAVDTKNPRKWDIQYDQQFDGYR